MALINDSSPQHSTETENLAQRLWGGCACNRLDQGLKSYVFQGGRASGKLISDFSDFTQLMSYSRDSEVPHRQGS